MEKLKKLLGDGLKWKQEWIDALVSDEEVDLVPLQEEIQQHTEQLFRATVGNEIKAQAIEEGKRTGALTYGGTLKNKVAKSLGLQISRNEVEKMDEDAFLGKVQEYYKQQLEGATALTDEKAKGRIEELQTKYQQAQDSLNEMRMNWDEQVDSIKQQAQQQIESFKVNDLKLKTMTQMPWSEHVDKEAGHLYITNKLDEAYAVGSDGSIKNKDGTRALRPDGHGFFDTYEEAYKWMHDARGYAKRSAGGTGGNPVSAPNVNKGQSAGSTVVTDDNAQDVLRAAREAALQGK
jgi:hypothetical protein